jgi:integrase
MARGRRARYTFPLQNGKTVGANFKVRGRLFYTQFPHPTAAGQYIELSTGVIVPKHFDAAKDPPADWFTETAKLIVRHYTPTLPTDPKRVTWAQVLKELPGSVDLRKRSLDVYRSIIRLLCEYVPETKGPGDISPELAKSFRSKYAAGTWRRGKSEDARTYKRQPKTIDNAIRRLSGLWGHLRAMGYANSNPWEEVPRPTIPKKLPVAPTEEDVTNFFKWLDAKHWEMMSAFLRVKALAGCRTADLCQVKSNQFDAKNGVLTIDYTQDKTHRTRSIPLPATLSTVLDRIKGPEYLWESYTESAKIHRPGRRNKDEFSPQTLYWAVLDLFEKYRKAYPERPPIRSHDLRRRAITLTVAATQSVDSAAEALGVHPTTARRHYIDSKAAFNSTELLKKMASVLVPPGSPNPAEG